MNKESDSILNCSSNLLVKILKIISNRGGRNYILTTKILVKNWFLRKVHQDS